MRSSCATGASSATLCPRSPEWHTRSMRSLACVIVVAALCLAAPAAQASDGSLRWTLHAGLASIGKYKRERLEPRLVVTLAALRADRASTPPGRDGRSLAIDGFSAALRAVRAELEFYNEDSGRLAEATKDASRADRNWKLAAHLLRQAGNALGVPVGRVNGR